MGIGAADSPRNDGGAPPDSVERQLLRDPYITMFRRPSALTSTIEQLSELGYDVRATDASTWAGVREMHPALADLLDFPDYYGHNLDALNDCLSDVAEGTYGVRRDARGLALVLWHYDAFAAANGRAAFSLLDSFTVQARAAAVAGRRMLCLVQSDDPQLSFPPVGATPVPWNGTEWQVAQRDS